MSALDDLVQAFQAAVTATESAQGDVAQAESSAEAAVQAAALLGREDDVTQTDALRADITEQAGLWPE